MIFVFISLDWKVHIYISNRRGPGVFQLQGENYHRLGSLKPPDGNYPKFLQLYIVDTENEVEDITEIMSKGKKTKTVEEKNKFQKKIIEALTKMINEVNPYVKVFRMAQERFQTNEDETLYMRIVADQKGKDGRTYSMPTTSEVAVLIPGDF